MTNPTIKQFNTTGPCFPEDHYMLPVLPRIQGVDEMISGKYYFIIHAPRQSGKTTYLQYLTRRINSEGNIYALNCSLATLKGLTDRDEAMTTMAAQLNRALKISGVEAFKKLAFPDDSLPQSDASVKISNILNYLSVKLDKDLIVFFDEADSMTEIPLVTFLSQIRDGYIDRNVSPESKFPRSMALVGMRDIRDYLTQVRSNTTSLGLASPFNVKKEALTLANFSRDEIGILYQQHTIASGQVFESEAVARAWYWSKGQPWLVNALAYECVVKILKKNYAETVTANIMDQAAEAIIKNRTTHIDSLKERLKEPRVIKVMDSVFAGTPGVLLHNSDDRQYCLDLGLVVEDGDSNLCPANAIYSEVMSRLLTDEIQLALDNKISNIRWHDDKIVYMSEILKQFQLFWRQNGFTFPLRINELDSKTHEVIKKELESLPLAFELNERDSLTFIGRVKDAIARQYDEAVYSLLLLAFLQKVVNSDALVHREFAQGRGAVDLCVIFKGRQYIVEVKLYGQKSLEESLEQVARYLDTSGEKEAWLVVFDRDRNKTWDDKITWETIQVNKFTIHIVGC
ncbi:MAG: AAA-like domain-containing protein [Deltaproteobacteria bacterium]|jgi:hypothetical protein|nr:AAA-like domain-containing protein [Deltaproteobacteria bacterium]